MTEPIDIAQKLSCVSEHWSPKVVARLNDLQVLVVKVHGEFVWHTHPETDELFWVVSGSLVIELRAGDVTLGPGQMYVVPRGVEHRPVAEREVEMVLMDAIGTVNTGDAGGELTAAYDDTLLS